MRSRCPLPVDWLDYLEGEKTEEISAHLRDCPSCRQVLASLSHQPGRIPDPAWAARFAHASGALLVEEEISEPGVAELWLSASHWRFDEVEYQLPERSLVLVLSYPATYESEELRWYDVAPVRTDIEQALPTDFLLDAAQSSFDAPLGIVFSLQCKVERRQLHTRVGHLHDVDIVFTALNSKTNAWRWGNPLEGPDDPRLWWEASFAETVKALRTPWLQYLDGAGRARAQDPSPAQVGELAEVLTFTPRPWRQLPESEWALAAAASDEDIDRFWELATDELRIGGVFDNDWDDNGELMFVIHDLHAKRSLRLRLFVYLHGVDAPLASETFEPKSGARVRWDDTHVPGEVKQLGAEVVR